MKKITKRYLSVLLTFALVLALPLAATQEVNAASGGKKINQPVQVTSTSNRPGSTPETTTYVYDKKGLVKQAVDSDGSRTDYTYSKTGIVKTIKNYDSKGVLFDETVNKIKGKKLRLSTNYDIVNGQRVLYSTTTYKYKKGKLAKTTYTRADGKVVWITTYRKNGKMSTDTYGTPNSNDRTVYDKHGNITSRVITSKDGTETWNYVNTYKKGKLRKQTATYTDVKGVVTPQGTTVYSYTKKGLLKEAITTGSFNDTYEVEDDEGNVTTHPYTYTITKTDSYTYTKAGLVKSAVHTSAYTDSTGDNSTTTNTVSIAYKKVKVKSKVRKEVKKWLKDFSEGYIHTATVESYY